MKLGYRERVGLLIVCVIVIFALGIVVFIKPKWEKLTENQKLLTQAQSTWETQLNEFTRINPKQDSIERKYEQGLEISKNFTDEMTSVEVDEYLQKNFVNIEQFIEDKVTLMEAFAVSDEMTTSLSYNYKTPNVVTYPLYEYADLDGSLATALAEKLHDSDILSSRSSQTVGVGHSQFEFRINREDFYTLIDSIEEYARKHSDAMNIISIDIDTYDFNEKYDGMEKQKPQEIITETDEDGNEVKKAVMAQTDEEGLPQGVVPNCTNVTIDYEVYYIQEPTKPDVGPRYDETVWDGDAWRAYENE
jgi:hypothetical protein